FATMTTMVPYMRYWVAIYSKSSHLYGLIGRWYYMLLAREALGMVEKERGVHYVDVEKAISRLAPRPLFMIHGQEDGYIKPSMARALFDRAKQPKEFWLVPSAKHNQAFHLVGEEYRRRTLHFFETKLNGSVAGQNPTVSVAKQSK